MVSNLKEAKNNSEKEFKVYITETLGKMVKVMAKDEYEAEIKARDKYNNEEIILYPEDVVDVDFEVVSSKTESLKETLYIDIHGNAFGEPGAEYSKKDIKEIWNNDHETDYTMQSYDSFNDWFRDTVKFLNIKEENFEEDFSYARPNAAKIYEIIEDGAFDESFILRQLLRNLSDDEIGQALENVIGSYKDLKWIASESLKEDYDSARPNMETILDALDDDFYSESQVLDALLRGLDDNMLGYILEDFIDEYKESYKDY